MNGYLYLINGPQHTGDSQIYLNSLRFVSGQQYSAPRCQSFSQWENRAVSLQCAVSARAIYAVQ